MVITIDNLIETLNLEDYDERIDQFTKMSIEAIASTKDSIIMNELMLDIIQKNSELNKLLETQLEEIKRLSITDQLTGIYNRRRFLEMLEKEINRFSHYNHPFTLIMFDIDHFKHVNDKYGHDIGDYVLKELTRLVSDRLRVSDTFSRWGGEEFMILLAETEGKNAEVIAEDIRKNIEENDFSPVPKITCSFGVITCIEKSMCDIAKLSKNVDEALYQAKKSGRNCIVVYEEESI